MFRVCIQANNGHVGRERVRQCGCIVIQGYVWQLWQFGHFSIRLTVDLGLMGCSD